MRRKEREITPIEQQSGSNYLLRNRAATVDKELKNLCVRGHKSKPEFGNGIK